MPTNEKIPKELKKFVEEIRYFCSKVTFETSFLDSRASRFMNNFSKTIQDLLEQKARKK